MQPTDRDAFAVLIAGVYEFYGKGESLSEFGLGVWWQALRGYDLDAVRDALGRHCVNPDAGQWLPKPADVVRLLDGGTQDAAQIAWATVCRAVESVSTYESVVFDDPLIHAVVADMGGWIALGAVKLDELPFRAREFEQRYRGYRMRGRLDAYPRSLPGIFDRDNVANGYPARAPVLVGDTKRAALVYERGGDGGGPQLRRLSADVRVPEARRLTTEDAEA